MHNFSFLGKPEEPLPDPTSPLPLLPVALGELKLECPGSSSERGHNLFPMPAASGRRLEDELMRIAAR